MPCIKMEIEHDNEEKSTVTVTDKERSASENEHLVQQKFFKNKSWGPGNQYFRVLVSKTSVKIALKMKTGGKEAYREYKFANYFKK